MELLLLECLFLFFIGDRTLFWRVVLGCARHWQKHTTFEIVEIFPLRIWIYTHRLLLHLCVEALKENMYTCCVYRWKWSSPSTKNKILSSQVKTMRALQYFPTIEDPNARRALFEVQHFTFNSCTHLYKHLWTIMIFLSFFRFCSVFWWALMLLKMLTRTMPHMLFSLKLLLWWVYADFMNGKIYLFLAIWSCIFLSAEIYASLYQFKTDSLVSYFFFFNKVCLHVLYFLTGHASGCWKGDDVTVCGSSWEVYCSPGTKYSVSWSGNCMPF